MSNYTLEDLNNLNYGVSRIGFLKWRAEFWTQDGEPVWLGEIKPFKKYALRELGSMIAEILDYLNNGGDTEES